MGDDCHGSRSLSDMAGLQEDRVAGGRKERGRTPRCIVLTPTRELAQQVKREFEESAPTLTVGCFYGGALRACLTLVFVID